MARVSYVQARQGPRRAIGGELCEFGVDVDAEGVVCVTGVPVRGT